MELNRKETRKYHVIEDYVNNKISNKQVAVMLEISLRHVRRLKKIYLEKGKVSFLHGNKQRTPINKSDTDTTKKIVSLYNSKFKNWNFDHFIDYITKNNEIKNLPSRNTIRRILSVHITSPKAHKIKTIKDIHPLRDRKQNFGELVQMDASKHDWLSNGSYIHLHLAIDDSSSRILAGYFGKEETLSGYLHLLYIILTTYGIPKCFYTDRRTVFEFNAGKRKINENIQFKRISRNLGIDIITTSVPQAKGRVERSFSTHQSRLLNELKLHNITTIKQANEYLEKIYIPNHNRTFAYKSNLNKNLFMPLTGNINLNIALGLEYPRSLLTGSVIAFNHYYYKLFELNSNKQVIFGNGAKIQIVITYDKKLYARNGDEYYRLVKFMKNDSYKNGHRPPIDHPWNRW